MINKRSETAASAGMINSDGVDPRLRPAGKRLERGRRLKTADELLEKTESACEPPTKRSKNAVIPSKGTHRIPSKRLRYWLVG